MSTKKEYVNLDAYAFIKWLSNAKGLHAHQVKACAARWIYKFEADKRNK